MLLLIFVLLAGLYFFHTFSFPFFFAVSSYFWQLASAYSRISSAFALSSPWLILRTLRSKDAMTTKTSVGKKVNLRSFSLSLTLSNIGEPSWS